MDFDYNILLEVWHSQLGLHSSSFPVFMTEDDGNCDYDTIEYRQLDLNNPYFLGFINLKPTISLTPAGCELISAKHTEEIFLRQL